MRVLGYILCSWSRVESFEFELRLMRLKHIKMCTFWQQICKNSCKILKIDRPAVESRQVQVPFLCFRSWLFVPFQTILQEFPLHFFFWSLGAKVLRVSNTVLTLNQGKFWVYFCMSFSGHDCLSHSRPWWEFLFFVPFLNVVSGLPGSHLWRAWNFQANDINAICKITWSKSQLFYQQNMIIDVILHPDLERPLLYNLPANYEIDLPIIEVLLPRRDFPSLVVCQHSWRRGT